MENSEKTKFCKHCGATIPADAVMCTSCGRQVETL
ncbi:MAG TPA: TM2 domain-containing protein, partial [Ruminococcaceae bacterium]|nr:TM2 domain-containing protein [Oscillospiraceae bacterium]